MRTATTTFIAILVILLIAVGGWYWWTRGGMPNPLQTGQTDERGLITLAIGQTGSMNDVTITPRQVVEDSRCPSDVQCVQAGRIRLRATIESGLGTANPTFLLGEPVTTETEAITLVRVTPAKVSTHVTSSDEYRFTFKVVKQTISYQNASRNMIEVGMPFPGSVTGKQFAVTGQARGNWFFEASFPVVVLDKDGNTLTTAIAQAQGEWMTTDFVPYRADVTIPDSYIGPATIVLQKDNPSGLPEHDASASYPITIEY